MTEVENKESKAVDESKRTFLKVAVVASAVLAAGGVGAIAKSISNPALASGGSAPPSLFPRVKVGNVSQLQLSKPVIFDYPLDNEPNILVKLGAKADGGVGPDSDIVAFSQICQHLGCPYAFLANGASPVCDASYRADRPVGYCCCHGTIYDFAHGAAVLGGPSPRPQPQVLLEVDSSGDIFATGMSAPSIFGHGTGSSDVTQDLQGGNLVS